MNLLTACQMSYRKHHLNDESIGWDELGDCLLDALCNEMGDDGYQEWLSEVTKVDNRTTGATEPLVTKIRRGQVVAAENAVCQNLKRMGF